MDLLVRFNVREFSDVAVNAVPAPGADGKRKRGRRFLVSKAVVGQSEFLEAMILRWSKRKNNDDGDEDGGEGEGEGGEGEGGGGEGEGWTGMELDVTVDEDLVDAFELVLRLMYGAKIGPAATAEAAAEDDAEAESHADAATLLKAYETANWLVAPRCVEVLGAALCAIDVEALGDDDACLALHLTDRLDHVGALGPLQARCVERLLRWCGDVPATIGDAARRARFCALPLAAVKAWVRSDDLVVHSENCVVFLVTAWMNAHPECSAAEQAELARDLRMQGVSPMYKVCILPKLAWFGHCLPMFERLNVCSLGYVEPSEQPELPPAWWAPERTNSGIPTSLPIELEVGREQICSFELYADGPLKYVNGAFMYVGIQYKKDGSGGIEAIASLDDAPMEEVLGFSCHGAVGLLEYVMETSSSAGGWAILVLRKRSSFMVGLEYYGDDLALLPGTTLEERLADWIVDGKLSLRARNVYVG